MKTEGPGPPNSRSGKIPNLRTRWRYSDAEFFSFGLRIKLCYPASAGGSILFFSPFPYQCHPNYYSGA